MTIDIQWLGHAAFKLRVNKYVLYIDPRFMKKFESKIGQFFEKPERADIILFTHHHADHCYPSSITKMHKVSTVYIGPEKCRDRIGNKLKVIKAGNELNIDDIHIKVVEAYNIKRRRSTGNLWHPKGLGLGYLINIEGKTIYHAGDTEVIPEMKNFGFINIAFLPIDGKFTMDINEAIDAAKIINPNIIIPMHNHESDLNEYKTKLEACCKIKVIILGEGEIYQFNE